MKPKQFMLLIFIIILISVHCDTTEPPVEGSLTLAMEDVSCTEAWLKLTTTNLPLPTTITLKQNDITRTTINLTTADTLLYIDSLLPKQTYKYQASGIWHQASGIPHSGGVNQASAILSNDLSVTTMDTTSHNFTFQTWTFGEHSSSVLYDVAIINENNIWAVGEIYMKDSLGRPDPNAYNAVHWDGTEWKLKRIPVLVNTTIFYPPITTIIAFGINDIWFGGVHWDGTKYTLKNNGWPLMPNGDGWRVNKLWGSSSNDLYAVGDAGNIAHYSNGSWRKIESGTTSIINDIWGIVIGNNETIAYCPVSSFWTPGDKKMLRIKGNFVDSIPWGFNKLLYSVWAINNRVIYVCGGGIFERRNNEWKEINITTVTTNRVRGNDLNDITVAGDFGFSAHFNGVTWNVEEYDFSAGYGGLSTKGKIVAVVGQRNGKAVIKIGKRN